MVHGESGKKTKRHYRIDQGKRQRAKTRALLIEAAIKVFAERGLQAPVVDDFITAANISRGTFYNHFNSKEDLLEAVAAELAHVMDEEVMAFFTQVRSPLERIGFALRQLIRGSVADESRGWLVVRMIPSFGGPLSERMRRMARRDIRNALIECGLPLQFVSPFLEMGLGLSALTIRRILTQKTPSNYPELAAQSFLQSFGIGFEEAQRIANLPFPLVAVEQKK